MIKEINDQRLLSPLLCRVVDKDTRQMTMAKMSNNKLQSTAFQSSAHAEHHHRHDRGKSNQHGCLVLDTNTRTVSKQMARGPLVTTKSYVMQISG